jgi:BirA family biotin operon repressor/biotin-[acetyl-CoA-carboxylase] ligase
LQPQLKWPNDVLIRQRKVCGVLCEKRGDSVLVGIGLNCNQREFPAEFADQATSLQNELSLRGQTGLQTESGTDTTVDVEHMMTAVLEQIGRTYGLRNWASEIEQRHVGWGREVTFLLTTEQTERFRGRIQGISPNGSLRVRLSRTGELREIYSGELDIQ